MKTRRMFRTRSIFSLPDELLSEILARVGACSLDDLLNAGLRCVKIIFLINLLCFVFLFLYVRVLINLLYACMHE